jgi:hypothetical protein
MKRIRLRRISVLSAGKVVGLVYAGLAFVIGTCIGLVALVGGLIGMSEGEDEAIAAVFVGCGAPIVLPIVYGTIGGLMAMLIAFLCNAVSKFAGGVELELEDAAS